MSSALILAGHGSHIRAETAGLVWAYVDQLRALGVADEVTAAFWKEQPAFSAALDTITAADVTVIPLFTAQGFFTRSVIPAEMGLAGPITRREGRSIRYARTLSEHPYLREVVRQRVADALHVTGFDPARTAVTVIGHGTKRSAESRSATLEQADHLRGQGLVAEVVATFLDDEPDIAAAYDLTQQPHLIAVPFFLAAGSHTTFDVPAALGLPAGAQQAQIHGRQVYYTDPVGTGASMIDALLALAHEAGAPLAAPHAGSAWDCFPAVGREALIRAVSDAGTLDFGQLRLTLERVSVQGDAAETEAVEDVGALRARLREEPFRPLASARDLPGGWHVPVRGPAHLHAVVETVYPGAVADWARRESFQPASFEQVTARQVGMYRDLAGFPQVGEVVAAVCGGCVRHPAWFDGVIGAIPCGEPCNVWLSAAKERLDG